MRNQNPVLGRGIRIRLVEIHHTIGPSATRYSHGNYLLEFAAVLAVLVPILLGAVDINSAMQGYTAVHAGTATAARCLYPTDAECVNSSASSPPAALYSWYRGISSQSYIVRYDNYSGTGYWLNTPTYTWDTYQAQVYTAASYTHPQRQYQAYDQQIALTQPLEIETQRASLPYVTGSDPENPTGFMYQADHSVAYDGALSVTVENSVVKPNAPGIIEITPPAWANTAAYRSLACFKTKGFDKKGDAAPNVKVACDRGAGPTPSFPLAFWIAGAARNGTSGVTAHYTLALHALGADGVWRSLNTVDLGGQEFGAPGPGGVSQQNFHPRGFVGGMDDTMNQKIIFHDAEGKATTPAWASNTLDMPADAEKILIVILPSTDVTGSLEYAITSVKAFAPQYAAAPVAAQCTAPDCSGPASCVPAIDGKTFGLNGGIKTVVALDAGSRNVALLKGPAQSTTTTVAFGAPKAFTDSGAAVTAFALDSKRCDVIVTDVGPAPDVRVPTRNCASDDFGSLPGSLAGCGVDGGATDVTYSTAWVSVPQTAKERAAFDWNYQWQKNSCADSYSDVEFSPPSGLQRYEAYKPANLSSGPQPTVSWSPATSIDGADPRPLIASGGRYACGDFTIGSEQFEGDGQLPAPNDKARLSLFAGLHPELSGTDGCLNATLKAEAETLGLPASAYFEPHAVFAEERTATEVPSTSECVAYRVEANFTGSQLLAENVPSGAAPSGCPSAECYSVYSGVVENTGTSVGYDLVKAQSWGEQELSSSYPRANYACAKNAKDADCAWVDATQSGDEISVTTTLNVPFYFIGNKTIPLTQTVTRKLESSFVN